MKTAQSCRSVAVSSPGGLSRQYRVQVFNSHEGEWRLHDAFRSQKLAEECVAELREEGQLARAVAYKICPTAN